MRNEQEYDLTANIQEVLNVMHTPGGGSGDTSAGTDEEERETVHVYPVEGGGILFTRTPIEPGEDLDTAPLREGQTRPSLAPVIISILALSLLIAIGVLTPYQQPEQRASIRVPAVLLPLKTFSVVVPVIATGVKTFPAITAHGILTITNGSVIAQELPKGFLLTGTDGIEVTTDEAVFVPAGSASGYGVATVSAHTVTRGKSGNIGALDIDSVEGSSVYIRNLSAFTGGQDAYPVKFVTLQDRQTALDSARGYLAGQVSRIRAKTH